MASTLDLCAKLHLAVRDASLEETVRLEVIRALLSQKADPNQHLPVTAAADTEGPAIAPEELVAVASVLTLALERGEPELCRLLLLHQADPGPAVPRARNLKRSSGSASPEQECAALVLAWASGDVPAVLTSLEDLAADAARAHDAGLLGLALASLDVAGGNAETCASRCTAGYRGGSLLHLCAREAGRAQLGASQRARLTARALMGWGAMPDEQNDDGETPLQLALRSIRTAASMQVGGSACSSSEPAKSLLEAGADAEQVCAGSEETLLMQAAREGDAAACQLLLEFAADPLRRSASGATAISLAGQPEVLLVLRTALTKDAIAELEEAPSFRARAAGAFSGRLQSRAALDSDDGDDSHEPPSAATRARRFSMSYVDQEMCSSEGLLNQVDLEESYEDDWNAKTFHSDWAHPEDHQGGSLLAAL